LGSVKWKKKYNVFLLIFLFVVIFLWVPFFIGAVYPKEYCLNSYCLKRPDNFIFSRFVNNAEQQSTYCFYTMSCKNKYKIDGRLNTLIFNSITGSQLSLSIGKENKKIIESESIYTNSNSRCKYSQVLSEENGFYRVRGYFIDDYVFDIFSDQPTLLKHALNDLCHENLND